MSLDMEGQLKLLEAEDNTIMYLSEEEELREQQKAAEGAEKPDTDGSTRLIGK